MRKQNGCTASTVERGDKWNEWKGKRGKIAETYIPFSVRNVLDEVVGEESVMNNGLRDRMWEDNPYFFFFPEYKAASYYYW